MVCDGEVGAASADWPAHGTEEVEALEEPMMTGLRRLPLTSALLGSVELRFCGRLVAWPTLGTMLWRLPSSSIALREREAPLIRARVEAEESVHEPTRRSQLTASN